MNRINKAAAWAVLLILFVLSGVIVHAQDETMSTNTPGSINEEASKEAIIEEDGKSVEVLFDASRDLVNEAVQAGAANEGDKKAEGNVVPGTPDGTDTTGEGEKDSSEQGTTVEGGKDSSEPQGGSEGTTTNPEIPGGETDTPGDGNQQTDPAEPGSDREATDPEESDSDETGKETPADPEKSEETPEQPKVPADHTNDNTSEEPAKPDDAKKDSKPQVDTSTGELKELNDQIKAEKDPKKKSELQKQYNDMLLKSIEETGADKIDPDTQKRLTEGSDIKDYNIIKAKQKEVNDKKQALEQKIAEGKASQADIDKLNEEFKKAVEDYNKLVGSFNPPRNLTDEETEIKKDYTKKPYINIDEKQSSEEGKAKYAEYKKYKEALDKALDPKGEGLTEEEYKALGVKDLKELKAKFDTLNQEVLDMINSTDLNKKIVPVFTDGEGKPKVDIYAYDFSGSVDLNKKIEDGKDYYIPDGTKLDLFVQVGRKNDGSKIKFTLTPKKVGEPEGGELSAREDVIFLNGEKITLTKNPDGTYSFETENNFGVAQLKFTIPAIYGELHEGFNIGIQVGDKEISNNFLITKKGYDENPETGSIGNTDIENPKKEDAGKTEGSKVTEHTDKLFNIFAMLKESNGYIDKVLVNSSNGQALPLAHVKITMTLPKNYDGKFAEYIHKSGLKYEKQEDGKYVLELDTKEFGKNLVQRDGKYYLVKDGKETELTKASEEELRNAILTGKDGKTYIDENGNEHKVTTVEVKDGTANDDAKTEYRLDGKTLYKKNADNKFEEVGLLNEKNIFVDTKNGMTYELRGDTLLIYDAKKVEDVYDGHVSNNAEGKAEPKITPTNEGKQVTIKEKEDSTDESYGGTIVEDAIFDKDKKYLGKSSEALQGAIEALIDQNGKKYIGTVELTKKDREAKFKEIDGVKYKIVSNAVFEKITKTVDSKEVTEFYIIDGLSYSDKLSLIDKFGRKMDIGVTEEGGVYTFTKKGHADKKSDGTKIIVGEDGKQIYVDNKNYKVKDTDKLESIVGKYYYDEEKEKFESLEDDEKKKKIIGDKYYPDLIKALLKNKEVYKSDKGEFFEANEQTKKLFGSDKKDDYFKAGDKYYAKQPFDSGDNEKTIFVGEDEILTEGTVKRIVQVLENGSERIVDVDSIFNAVNQAKFQIKFPGFLAGKKVVYTLKTDIAADYEHVNPATNKTERISIYKNEDGNHKKAGATKTINKYFTLNNEENKENKFFKEHPEALEKNLDYNFFNIFFRDGRYRQRDAYIGKLLKIENDSTNDELKKANKKELNLLAKLRNELRRLTGNDKADFKYEKDTLTFVAEGKAIEIDRTLLWKVGFNNPDGALFPEDSDSEITIEDHNMDNRLVYDEIIINHTRKKYKEAEEAAKTNRTEFKGNKEYFFLDQIKRIFLGVNPNYKDYRFVPAGENYLITREDIQNALNSLDSNNEGTITKGTGENAISYKVTYDPTTAQIKIKVFDAFYKQHKATDTDKNHFESPVQEGYKKWIDGVNSNFDEINSDDVEEFKNAFNQFIEKTYKEKSDCLGVLKEKFEKMIEEIDKLKDDAKKAKIAEFKKAFKAELEKLNLAYLDSAKNGGKYKFDDMRFNALRIELEAGQSIGGAMDKTKKKYLGISSVIVPDIDIPFTDEFGDKLTNKDLYLNQEVKKILENSIVEGQDKKTYKEADLNDEFKFRKIMEEAYKRVNALKDKEGNSLIKDLVEVKDENKDKVGIEKYTVKHGEDFVYDDFAIGEGADKKSLKDKAGHTVNPFYVGDGKKVTDNIDEYLKAYEGKINAEEFKKSDLYKELTNPEIEIGVYYMHELGYNRAKFANKANYKLNKVGQGPGIFGQENNWKNKVCYPGIGQCIENAGGEDFPGEEGNKAEDEKKMKAEDDFSLSYSPATPNFESENPKFDKKSEINKIDISKEKDEKVDYTVDLTVDKLKTDQKIGGDSTKPIDPKAAAEEAKNYNKRGYFVYKNSLIIDFLPEIFRFETGSSMTLTIKEEALKANGANTNKEFNFEDFKSKAKPIYVENVYEYLKTLSGDQKTALENAIALAEKQGKLDRNGNKHAVLAWLPEFEAPHGSKEPQFKLEIKQLVVDKKQFKEYEAHKYSGEKFTNHAVFDIFYAHHPITITDGHKGNVDKTMRIYDEKGNIVNKDKAEEWFRGYVELKFGDQYDYKIKYKHVKPGYEDINSSNRDKEAEFVDFFATKDKNNGFRPVLRELLDLKNGYYAEYSLDGETFLSKEQIQAKIANKEITLGDILGVKIKHEQGFEINKEVEFVLPMMIPNLDAKVEDGKVYYIGQDGKRVELGNAKKFFKLDKLKSSDEKDDMYATNKVDGSNTVTVYLEKERFIRVFKEFFESDGKTEIKKDRPEVKFEIKQIEKDENGKVVKEVTVVDKDGKPVQLIVNEKNKFTDMVDHLPIFKKTTTIDEDGNVTVNKVSYEYKLVEKSADGYDVEYKLLDDGKDQLGFVWKATNTEKPTTPPGEPGDEPKEVKVTIKVNKVWKVLNGGSTPSIQVELYANGKATGKIITLGDGNWSASFKDLPAKDKDGKEIIYTVREVGEADYITEIGDRKFEVSYVGDIKNGFTITNEEVPPEEPEEPEEEEPEEPDEPETPETPEDQGGGKNVIPKTGVRTDLGSIFFSGILLLALFFFKRKFFKN